MRETQLWYWSTLGQSPTARVRPRATLAGCVRCSTAAAAAIRYTPVAPTYSTLSLSLCSARMHDEYFDFRVGVPIVERKHGKKRPQQLHLRKRPHVTYFKYQKSACVGKQPKQFFADGETDPNPPPPPGEMTGEKTNADSENGHKFSYLLPRKGGRTFLFRRQEIMRGGKPHIDSGTWCAERNSREKNAHQRTAACPKYNPGHDIHRYMYHFVPGNIVCFSTQPDVANTNLVVTYIGLNTTFYLVIWYVFLPNQMSQTPQVPGTV